MMDIKRIAKHLLMTHWQVKKTFPREALLSIEQAIKATEAAYEGEIRFVVEGALDTRPLLKGQSARERALYLFSHLRIWDTEHNNGLLIYLLLADHAVEIVADRGVDVKVGAQEWETICHQMESAFQEGDFTGGAVRGIQAVSQHLIQHFPATSTELNELSDSPVVL